MSNLKLKKEEGIATITLNRPPVNALNDQVIEELKADFDVLRADDAMKVVVLMGEGSFFSFGFDVPGFMSYSKEDFSFFVESYSAMIKEIFMFPKPVVAAINGHAVAGGCILALACDFRLIKSGKTKIALNEMTFGSTLFSCVTETLKYVVGDRTSEEILYSGKMNSAEEALELGIVDKIANENEFESVLEHIARDFAHKDLKAFLSIKMMLKRETLNKIVQYEKETITEFVEIWYSESTRKQLEKIEIRG